jgi:hypothetical protein
MVRTRFATGRAKFIQLDVFKQGAECSKENTKQAVEVGIGYPRKYRHGEGMGL